MSDETADDDNLTGQRLLLACVVLVYIAAGLWSGRAWISSWFASAYIGTINLLTIDESDDARLQRAFAAVRGGAGRSGDRAWRVRRACSAWVRSPERADIGRQRIQRGG